MDTDAIYSAIASRIVSSKRGYHEDAEFYQDEIKRLLNEADDEHKSLLATNEKLMDEVAELRQENQRLAQAVRWESDLCQQALESRKELETENAELKAKLTDKASLLRGCYARINTLERTLTHIHGVALAEDHRDLPGIAKDAKEALEKKHEGTT